jgi:hypothetical protein
LRSSLLRNWGLLGRGPPHLSTGVVGCAEWELSNSLLDDSGALGGVVVGDHGRVREPRVVRHVYLDETKQQGYVVAAAVVVEGDVEPLRRVVRGLVLPGQRRLHMKTERDSRRRQIVAALVEVGVEVVLYDAGRRYRTDVQARG